VYGSIKRLQKHFESGGALAKKGHFCIRPKSNDFILFTMESPQCRKWPLQSFNTTAKRALSFQLKRVRSFIQEILFSLFNPDFSPEKRALFSHLKKVYMPPLPPGYAAPDGADAFVLFINITGHLTLSISI
jgi:hypothetical protein